MSHVLVIGHGMAGGRIAAELRARSADIKLTVLGAEPERAYNRILLSQVLAGKVTEPDVALVEGAERGVDVRPGHQALAINPTEHTVLVRAPDGQEEKIGYDQLVLATGGAPIIPPLAGLDPDHLPHRVAVFRTLADCRRILTVANTAHTALVLGGGLLGLEAARGLASRGITVQVVHAVGHLMERQLDPAASTVLVDTLTRLGITTHLNSAATTVTTDHHGVTLQLADRRHLRADLLVISCGVRPETTLATTAALATRRGILIDNQLRTSNPHIYAIGDCAELKRAGEVGGESVSGLVAPAWEQARVLARLLTDDPHARYQPLPTITRLKADGIDLAAMGTPEHGTEQLTFTDPARGTYARLAINADRLVGAILLGDNPAVGTIIQLFDRNAPVPTDRRSLLLGRALGVPEEAAPAASPALMPDAATICHCNTVRKGDLVRRWREGTHTVDEMVAATRASSGCGTCRDAVEGIVDWLNRTDTVEVLS